ncbi:MAG: dienelactone hydrolase family protein [Nitrospinales bacterium]
MKKRLVVVVFLIAVAMLLESCVSSSGNITGRDKFQGISDHPEKELILNGKLTKPEGEGPFHAVVMLHRCKGIEAFDYEWASRLNSWGYVAFIVDSLGPRNKDSNCSRNSMPGFRERAMDAHSAKSYLAGLSFVNPNRIGVMGWSNGGVTTLTAIHSYTKDILPPEHREPFKAAVAFYPYCMNRLDNSNAPLLILIGEKDDWTPANACSEMIPPGKTAHEIKLKIYKNTHHCFDCTGRNKVYMGHTLRYNSMATADAKIQVRKFLDKYLK